MTGQLSKEFLETSEFQEKLRDIIKKGDMSTLTAGNIRHMLEVHFEFEKDALKEKPFKKMINGFIDDIMASEADTENDSRPAETLQSNKRKASVDSEKEVATPEITKTKKAKLESDHEEEEEEEEEQEEEEEEEREEEEEGEEEEEEEGEREEEEEDFSSPKTGQKRKTSSKDKSKVPKPRAPGSEKDEETIKKLKQFVSKCGVRKVWSRELADCKTAKAEIKKLKDMLEELGVQGRPTIEKCETVKRERELKAELDSLDKSLIIDQDNQRPTRAARTKSATKKPNYVVDRDTESEEEDETDNEEDIDEGENEEEEEQAESESEDEFNDVSDEE